MKYLGLLGAIGAAVLVTMPAGPAGGPRVGRGSAGGTTIPGAPSCSTGFGSEFTGTIRLC